jgi:hypothetical protein
MAKEKGRQWDGKSRPPMTIIKNVGKKFLVKRNKKI